MMHLLIKAAFAVVLITFCGVWLVRWWLNRNERVMTHDYARADGELLTWRQAMSERIKDPLVVLTPVAKDSANPACPLEEITPELTSADSSSTTRIKS